MFTQLEAQSGSMKSMFQLLQAQAARHLEVLKAVLHQEAAHLQKAAPLQAEANLLLEAQEAAQAFLTQAQQLRAELEAVHASQKSQTNLRLRATFTVSLPQKSLLPSQKSQAVRLS